MRHKVERDTQLEIIQYGDGTRVKRQLLFYA